MQHLGKVVIGLISMTIIMSALLYFQEERKGYCRLACEDMRACSFSIPPNCEGHCELGKRSVVLPDSCEKLKQTIDKAGFLF